MTCGPNRTTVSERTDQVIEALKANNLTLNEEKCELLKEEVSFLGHSLSAEGFGIDKAKVQDILSFEKPTNTKDLRSFLGLASYLSEFIESFSDLVDPMWKMINADPFLWTNEAEWAFEQTKKRVAEVTTSFGFFEEEDDTIIYVDASPRALGAVLVQEKDGKPQRIICFASKSLTPTERNYPHIQKEALAVIWAVERLYFYVMGRHFTICTDARALEFIFNRDKDMSKRALSRAEGWALRLSCYDYTIQWIEGEINIADPSSRLSTEQPSYKGKRYETTTICAIETEPEGPFGPVSLEEVRRATEKDKVLWKVHHAIETENWDESDNELKPFEALKDELRVVDGIVTRVGDLVYMKRVTRTKGQAPFDPTKFEIVSIARGDCVIRGPDGTEYKRSVTQLKKAPGKRKIDQNKEQIERKKWE